MAISFTDALDLLKRGDISANVDVPPSWKQTRPPEGGSATRPAWPSTIVSNANVKRFLAAIVPMMSAGQLG